MPEMRKGRKFGKNSRKINETFERGDSMSMERWQYGRDPIDPEILVNGRAPESEHRLTGEENPRLCEMRRDFEFMRDLNSCDYSLDSIEI